MTDRSLRPNSSQIRKLINAVFDDSALNGFCLDHYPQIYDRFGQGMQKDSKITLLLDHCRRSPSGVNELLQIIRKGSEELFENFQPYFVSDELITAKVDSRNPIELISELVEWKLVHNETQILLNSINIPFDYLVSCRYDPDRKKLDEAGFKWQRHCVPKLKDIPDKWKLQYAHTSVLDDLRAQTLQLKVITRQLMQIEPIGSEFNGLFLVFEEFLGILWDLLTVADKRIMVLIESLRTEIGE